MRKLRLVLSLALFFSLVAVKPLFAGESNKPWLGVIIQDIASEAAFSREIPSEGVLVSDVIPGGPADEAGMNPDDVIIRLNGKDIEGAEDLIKNIENSKAGDTVAIEVNSGETFDVTLGVMPLAMMDKGPEEESAHEGCAKKERCSQKEMKCESVCHDMEAGCRKGQMIEGEKYDKMYFKALRVLDLTPDQKKKALAISSEHRKKVIKYTAEIKIVEMELDELVEAEPVSLEKVKIKLNEVSSRKADLRFFGIKNLEEFKKILTPEQLSRLRNEGPACPLEKGAEGHAHGDR
ncbi:MAG: PDZ domain-containing protein [Deltaproteobacteria bacterium]|nr:PDZ domain-containing protein [Deltaproteobacteria bacterium]